MFLVVHLLRKDTVAELSDIISTCLPAAHDGSTKTAVQAVISF